MPGRSGPVKSSFPRALEEDGGRMAKDCIATSSVLIKDTSTQTLTTLKPHHIHRSWRFGATYIDGTYFTKMITDGHGVLGVTGVFVQKLPMP